MADRDYKKADLDHEAEAAEQAQIEASIVETDAVPEDVPEEVEFAVSFDKDYAHVSVATGTVEDGDVVDAPTAALLRDVPGVTVEAKQ